MGITSAEPSRTGPETGAGDQLPLPSVRVDTGGGKGNLCSHIFLPVPRTGFMQKCYISHRLPISNLKLLSASPVARQHPLLNERFIRHPIQHQRKWKQHSRVKKVICEIQDDKSQQKRERERERERESHFLKSATTRKCCTRDRGKHYSFDLISDMVIIVCREGKKKRRKHLLMPPLFCCVFFFV